jgi:sensor histidine kinase YesM
MLFFAPIKGIILVVAIVTIVDTAFGVWKAKKLGEEITSKIFRHGFVPKLLSYIALTMLVYCSDVFIINELTKTVVSVDFISTKLISLVLISNEVKSMDESFIKVKGYSFIEKLKQILNKLKDIKKELK